MTETPEETHTGSTCKAHESEAWESIVKLNKELVAEASSEQLHIWMEDMLNERDNFDKDDWIELVQMEVLNRNESFHLLVPEEEDGVFEFEFDGLPQISGFVGNRITTDDWLDSMSERHYRLVMVVLVFLGLVPALSTLVLVASR